MIDLISGIPSEVLTGLGSAIVGAWTKLQAQKHAQQQFTLELLARQTGLADASANAAQARGGEWVRRGVALLAGFFVFGVPSIVALAQLAGHTPLTTYLYNKSSGGFWFFRGPSDDLYSAVVTGYVITPLHTHLASMIMCYYFGAGIVKKP
ncbi:MAG: hypothetical protein Q7P63_04565 [Verrucomicrobiota bacterium JB022]|nr:hypothetical protein [Verrucomicrobiota bacterium JB022]